MAAHSSPAVSSATADGIESLDRLKQVETDADLRLRTVRGKIDQTLTQLRDDSEAQIIAARQQAEEDAAGQVEQALVQADAEADRVLRDAQAQLGLQKKPGPDDVKPVWPAILGVLFGEFA